MALIKNYVIVWQNAFNIPKRIKSINKNYIVVFNKISNKFELHYKKVGNVELVFPFLELTKKCVDYVLKTQMKNKKYVLEEMEKTNEKLREQQIVNAKQELICAVKN